MDGSSRTYMTPDSSEPSCEARRMRCASPPDRVAAARSSVRYSRPTSSRKPSRAFTSFRISLAIWARAPVNPRPLKWALAAATVRDVTSTMLLPASSTARDSGRRRAPLQARQSCSRKYLLYHCRVTSDDDSCMRFLMVLTTPAKRMAHEPPPCLPCHFTATRRSPEPYSMTSRWRGVRLFHGLSRGTPNSRDTAAATLAVHPLSLPGRSPHGSMAPSSIDISGLGTTRSGSISRLDPSPLQSTHI